MLTLQKIMYVVVVLVWHFKKLSYYCISQYFNDCHILSSKNDIYNHCFVEGTTFFVAQFNSHMLNENTFPSTVNTLLQTENTLQTENLHTNTESLHWNLSFPKSLHWNVPSFSFRSLHWKHWKSLHFLFPNLWFPFRSHLRMRPQNGFQSLSRSQLEVPIGLNPNPNKLSNLFRQYLTN